MAVTLRLSRRGQKKRPFYRIVAANKSARRDGRFLEIVGTYNPMTDPSTVELKEDRIRERIEAGAETSDVVAKIIKQKIPGLLEERSEKKLAKLQAQRKARKARSQGKDKKVSEAKAKKKAKKAKSKKAAA